MCRAGLSTGGSLLEVTIRIQQDCDSTALRQNLITRFVEYSGEP